MGGQVTNVGDEFKPGQEVPRSGIHTVVHDSYHSAEHEVTLRLWEDISTM